jgi:hypothetical protein
LPAQKLTTKNLQKPCPLKTQKSDCDPTIQCGSSSVQYFLKSKAFMRHINHEIHSRKLKKRNFSELRVLNNR